MLTFLKIQNFALIENLEIYFNENLNIITGETGAGKSILLGALSLLLGQRVDSSKILDNSRKCIVEANFDFISSSIKKHLEKQDLDTDIPLIIRREITTSGKSRAFINDTPVNLLILRQISELLIDIHSQNQNILLNSTDFQLELVDSFAENKKEKLSYKKDYEKWKEATVELNRLKNYAKQSSDEFDYLSFQYEKLVSANLDEINLEDLESEQKRLENSEFLTESINQSLNLIQSDDQDIIGLLNQLKTVLSGIEIFLPALDGSTKRLESVSIELDDIYQELEKSAQCVEPDPIRLDFINTVLDTLYSLFKKHNCSSVDKLIEIRDNIKSKIDSVKGFELDILKQEKHVQQNFTKLEESADLLTRSRLEQIPELSNKIVSICRNLGMPNVSVKFNVSELVGYKESGKDDVQLMFSANKAIEIAELERIASGGEISRLMLAIKSILAKKKEQAAIVFDEIDTGVSGEVAAKMGKLFKLISKNQQIIAITHLPQVAAIGNSHYLVSKDEKGKKAITKITKLTKSERERAIASMLSSDKISDISLENAKDLIKRLSGL